MLDRRDVLRLASQIQGWCEASELAWLYDQAVTLGHGCTWVEVGVWKGRSLCPAMLSPSSPRVVAIDTFRGHAESLTHFEAGDRFVGWVRGHLMLLDDLAQKFGAQPLHLLEMDSLEASDLINEADFVLLDQDYRDDGITIRDDIEAWLPKVRSGGTLAGECYGGPTGNVAKIVDELLPGRILPAGSIWAWRKS